MYGDFLKEAAGIWQNNRLVELGEQFIAVSFLWDAVAELLWKLSQTGDIQLLDMISERVQVIYCLLYTSIGSYRTVYKHFLHFYCFYISFVLKVFTFIEKYSKRMYDNKCKRRETV